MAQGIFPCKLEKGRPLAHSRSMGEAGKKGEQAKAAAAVRKARLAAALKANLKRRKTQQRARDGDRSGAE